ncbi:hypothetical protein OsJ_08136 [Oryza sativa Japonica Group]|uniref:Uncharacterized protein n=1 Tax=Oryza sativa subsp. japonica TaxID=39947 RepID=B9F2C9_ORYSJ|nr:hypothetical protein OsJ_08136 [Oryza sativa Japonica Group]
MPILRPILPQVQQVKMSSSAPTGGTQPKELSVRFGADHIASARLVHVSEHVDLALIRVQGAPNCIPLGFSDEADLSGKEVVAIGFFGLDGTSMGEAVVFPTDSDDLNEFSPTNLPTAKGMSGAPVLLEDKVAGVLCNSDAALGMIQDGVSPQRAISSLLRQQASFLKLRFSRLNTDCTSSWWNADRSPPWWSPSRWCCPRGSRIPRSPWQIRAGIDKQGAAADAGELLSGQVKAVRKPWRSRCRRRRGTSFGLDEKEELVACHRDARLGGELDGGHRDDGGDGEGEGVDDGGAAVADVVLEDKELATGVVDAARVAVGHGGDRGPGGGGRVGGVEEESLAAGRHDAMRRPVPGQVVRLGEEGRERREGADGSGEEVEERRGEVGGVDGERPPVRGDVEDAVAARSGGGGDGGGGEGGRR